MSEDNSETLFKTIESTNNKNKTNNIIQSGQNRKPKKKTEQWEITVIGNFLLELYHKNVITSRKNWEIEKHLLRQEFNIYMNVSPLGLELTAKFKEACGKDDIGSLLYRTNFLINTQRGTNYFRIKDFPLLEYQRKKRVELDEKQRNGESASTFANGFQLKDNSDSVTNLENLLDAEHKVGDNAEKFNLEYQKSKQQSKNSDFVLSSLGCYICQQNFETIEQYGDHVEYHGDESDFKSLDTMDKLSSPMFNLFYQLCEKSHYFCFTLAPSLENIIIDKIIIVQSRSFFYVNNSRMPHKVAETETYTFFVDSHIFTIFQEQPIVVVFRKQEDKQDIKLRYVEQHHFMRTEPFPTVHFAINPYRLPNTLLFKPKFKLDLYPPSQKILKNFSTDENNETLLQECKDFREYYEQNKSFTIKNMPKAMRVILNIEDIELLNSYRLLTQHKVKLRQFGREVSIKLNLKRDIFLENVLSPHDEVLMIDECSGGAIQTEKINFNDMDMIIKSREEFTRKAKRIKQKTYYGHVERVSNRRVTFECDRKIQENNTYTVIFRPMRLQLRHQYRALQLLQNIKQDVLQRFLFPNIMEDFKIDRTMDALAAMYNLDLNDRSIYQNPEQLQAVQQINSGTNLEAPYIIYGPPGTGKTATIVEAITQLFLRQPYTRILIMAGSNSACDEIALRLLRTINSSSQCEGKTLTRVFSKSNDKRIDNIDEVLLEYSNMYATHFYPHVDILHMYRIVVCTLSVAGKLATGNFGKDAGGASLFTHVFVDEAAASTEAETLMGIICAISPRANLILSGDHKQLGPVLQSQRASDLGLSVSMMERLLQRECYKVDENDDYNRTIQTRLRRNYRSHPEIVKLFSDLYYDRQLVACADKSAVDLCEKWHTAPNPNFPIMFHAEFGTALRGSNTVSLSNSRELDTVMHYVKDLMYFGINGQKIKQTDIGIISPYKKQYTSIQEQLNIRKWHNIECGSVETFQGKEKHIIIVSFVRSFTSTLGFLDNPRRLNVTLSRAKSLLILIGNPHTLSLNDDFKFIIETCKLNKTLIGSKIYENPKEKEPIINSCSDISKKKRYRNNKKSKNMRNDSNGNNSMKISEGDTVALGRPMKKRVNTALQQKQRQKIVTLKTIMKQNENAEKNLAKDNEKTEIDRLFDELPQVPKSILDNSSPQAIKNVNAPTLESSTLKVVTADTRTGVSAEWIRQQRISSTNIELGAQPTTRQTQSFSTGSNHNFASINRSVNAIHIREEHPSSYSYSNNNFGRSQQSFRNQNQNEDKVVTAATTSATRAGTSAESIRQQLQPQNTTGRRISSTNIGLGAQPTTRNTHAYFAGTNYNSASFNRTNDYTYIPEERPSSYLHSSNNFGRSQQTKKQKEDNCNIL